MVDETVVFVAAGDLHTGECPPERIETVFAAAARHPEAAFLAVPGDLTNAGLPDQYARLEPLIAKLPMPFLGVMGNHDALSGPDHEKRSLFCRALGLEGANYRRDYGGASFVFLSADRDVDGLRVEISRGIGLLEETLRAASGPVVAFCHAPLRGTIGGVDGRPCFLSDDPGFWVGSTDDVRALVRREGKPLVWVSGHTHTPLETPTLIYSEDAGGVPLHSVNVSSPYYTGRDGCTTEPLLLYRFEVRPNGVHIDVRNAATGAVLRIADLPLTNRPPS